MIERDSIEKTIQLIHELYVFFIFKVHFCVGTKECHDLLKLIYVKEKEKYLFFNWLIHTAVRAGTTWIFLPPNPRFPFDDEKKKKKRFCWMVWTSRRSQTDVIVFSLWALKKYQLSFMVRMEKYIFSRSGSFFLLFDSNTFSFIIPSLFIF